jgi:streptogramin lyase
VVGKFRAVAAAAGLALAMVPHSQADARDVLLVTNAETVRAYDTAGTQASLRIPAITGVLRPVGVAVDRSGRVYVASARTNDLEVYDAGSVLPSHDDVSKPLAVVHGGATAVNDPEGMSFGPDGRLYVAETGADEISVYPSLFGGTGVPVEVLGAPSLPIRRPGALAIDAKGRIAVANFSDDTVSTYARGGDGAWQAVATIAGPATTLVSPSGVAFDGLGRLYVASANADSVAVFPVGATGDAVPSRVLRGPHTGLHNPTGIAVSAGGELYIANYTSDTIERFASGATGDASPSRVFADPSIEAPLALALVDAQVALRSEPTPAASLGSLRIFAYFPDAVVRTDGTFPSIDGTAASTQIRPSAGQVTIDVTLAKGTTTGYAGVLIGRSSDEGYLLDLDGNGTRLLRKYDGGNVLATWPQAPAQGPNDLLPHHFMLTVRRDASGLVLRGTIDGSEIGPVRDPTPLPLPEPWSVVLYAAGPQGALSSFRITGAISPLRRTAPD